MTYQYPKYFSPVGTYIREQSTQKIFVVRNVEYRGNVEYWEIEEFDSIGNKYVDCMKIEANNAGFSPCHPPEGYV